MGNGRGKHLPRSNLRRHRLPSWRMHVEVDEGDLSHNIFFGAFKGGGAKSKGLPKLQSFLEKVKALNGYRDGTKIDFILEKCGKRNGAPSYINRARCSCIGGLLCATRPSSVFKVLDGRSGGNGRH